MDLYNCPPDIMYLLLNYLSDRTKVSLLETNKYFYNTLIPELQGKYPITKEIREVQIKYKVTNFIISKLSDLVMIENYPLKNLSLYFDDYFNETISHISANVDSLNFGYRYNKVVPILENTLRNLTFGTRFNKRIISLPDQNIIRVYQCYHIR